MLRERERERDEKCVQREGLCFEIQTEGDSLCLYFKTQSRAANPGGMGGIYSPQ